MIQDIHSHTYYSFCGKDTPESIVEAAIAGGIQLFGICDHNAGAGFCRLDAFTAPIEVIPNEYDQYVLHRYFDHISLIKEKYAEKIRILRGIEVGTAPLCPKAFLPASADVSFFDYCLIEHLDREDSITGGDLFPFVERCGCACTGVAHTDLFRLIERRGEDPYRYFCRMAEQNIFWEINVNYDSTHGYRQHKYVDEFFLNEQQQAIVRESGVRLGVGFDGHKVEDYLPERVREYCCRITDLGIKLAFEE